jgi:hypothetical protein
MTSFWWLVPIGLLAAAGSACAWLILSKTPAVDTVSPTVDDTAVETPEVGAVIPPAVPASGAPRTDFDRHVDQALAVANDRPTPEVYVHAFCAPCRSVMCFRHAGEVIAHIRSHQATPAEAAHFTAWEHELQDQS